MENIVILFLLIYKPIFSILILQKDKASRSVKLIEHDLKFRIFYL